MRPPGESDLREALKQRISGFEISGEYGPFSDAGESVCTVCWFEMSGRYIMWEYGTQKEQEMVDLPDEPLLKVSADGFLQQACMPAGCTHRESAMGCIAEAGIRGRDVWPLRVRGHDHQA